jgi:primosomal protein N' (replication factor Y)
MRSAFKAFSLVLHISSMTSESVFIQTRNGKHYVLQSLSRGKINDFYDEEMSLRKEFGFSPFKHWVRMSWRGKSEKSTQEASQQVYNGLNGSLPDKFTVTPPLADAVGRKRGQFRFNVMVQANDVPQAVAFIKSTLAGIKRPSRVILTFNIDP